MSFEHRSPVNKHNWWYGLCYWSHVTRSGRYINGWDKRLTRHTCIWMSLGWAGTGHTSVGRVGRYTDLVGYVQARCQPSLRGPSTQALTLLGWARFIAWRMSRSFLGEFRRGPRHFWECRACLGHGLALGPTKKRLCAILVRLVGRKTNTDTRA